MNECRCDELTLDFRYCEEHHSYRDGTRQLASVSSVIASVLPQDFSGIDPAVLENARERGCQVDDLFCEYIMTPEIIGTLKSFPVGTRFDSIALFWKLVDWWESEKRGKPIVQGIVRDNHVAGKFDFWCDGILYDLKTVYNLRPHYPIQVAAYKTLSDLEIIEMKLVHVTERFTKPKLVTVPVPAIQDWYTVKAAWNLKRRLNGGV